MNIKVAVFQILHPIVAVIAPKFCLVCDKSLLNGAICHSCTPKIPMHFHADRCRLCWTSQRFESNSECTGCLLHPLAARQIRYLWEYGDEVRELIRAMKYNPSRKLANLAGDWLSAAIPTLFGVDRTWDMIVPVPASPFNKKRRPFNQCEVLAIALSHGFEFHHHVCCALKHRKSTPQAWLSHDERVSRMKNMFSLSGKPVAGKRILLVEDVITTGATTAAAVASLLSAGAAEVDVVALARAKVWGRFRGLIHKRLVVNNRRSR